MIMPLKGFISKGQNENLIFNNNKFSCLFNLVEKRILQTENTRKTPALHTPTLQANFFDSSFIHESNKCPVPVVSAPCQFSRCLSL